MIVLMEANLYLHLWLLTLVIKIDKLNFDNLNKMPVFLFNILPYCTIFVIATTQPTTQNNLKQLLLGWYYYR